jgi:RNA polymerase sigma factor (sigma-70 family)
MTNRDESDTCEPNSAGNAVLEAFIRYRIPLRRFVARFMRNTADVDDVTQEAFLRAFSVERGREIKQPKSFLFRIAKHIALTQLTQKSRQITSYIADFDMEDFEGSEVIGVVGSTEDEVIGRETLGVHCEAVATLPPQCRQVYLLRKVHGLSHKEIASHLGIAVSTVEKHLIKGVELCDRYVQHRTGAALSVDKAQETLGTPAPRRDRRA